MSKMIKTTICVLIKFLLFYCSFSPCSQVSVVPVSCRRGAWELRNSALGARQAQSSRKSAVALQKRTPSQMRAPGVAFAFPALPSAQTTWAVAVPRGECSSSSNFAFSPSWAQGERPCPSQIHWRPQPCKGRELHALSCQEGVCMGRGPDPERKRHSAGKP